MVFHLEAQRKFSLQLLSSPNPPILSKNSSPPNSIASIVVVRCPKSHCRRPAIRRCSLPLRRSRSSHSALEGRRSPIRRRSSLRRLLPPFAAGRKVTGRTYFAGRRFNIAADLITEATNACELGFATILVWMRFMATRQLIWNKNYNVKPREINRSQDRLTDMLQDVYISCAQYRGLLRIIMSTVGRGGEGDVGPAVLLYSKVAAGCSSEQVVIVLLEVAL